MPDPYKQTVQEKLWLLLEAHDPFIDLFLVGNKLKQTEAGWLKRTLANSPAQFPRVEITNGRFTHSGYTTNPSYATEQAISSLSLIGDTAIRRRCEYLMTITGRGMKSQDIDPAEEEAQVAILKGGPKLGLTYVVEWGPLAAEQKPDETGSRLQSLIVLPVLMEFTAAALTA